eukprot:TRINITY_DN36408_c0_g1_i1.p1 TRINITY_DN36408_c0_g1~~TRINITY_DN36408_c0_g1_i1.p1  ORF type:complete len:1346 (+),score=395.84 TRINITY_DN36408_c0_g1_i1:227-4264(+)
MGCGSSTQTKSNKDNAASKKNNNAEQPATPKGNKNNAKIKYSVTVWTGDKVFAGTDARVYVRLVGSIDASPKLELTNDTRDDDDTFEKGDKNTFVFQIPDLGDLMSLDVSHDGSGFASGWFLERVAVINHAKEERRVFPCNHYIKSGRGRNLTPLPKSVTAKPNPTGFEISSAEISLPHHKMQAQYDVIVIGSGYGGSIAASRFARAGKKVALFERGREFQPGQYPANQAETLGELQISGLGPIQGKRDGLYDFRMGDDISVFQGCGLGGTSLVNANVALPPKPEVFDDPKWPKELRGKPDELEIYIQQASIMLQPSSYPSTYPRLHKAAALKKAGDHLKEPFYYPPLTVTWEDRINEAGVNQAACNNCGNCMTGCNYGAKNTLIMNYIPDARNHGAEIYCQIDVRQVGKTNDGMWQVQYQSLASGFESFDAPNATVLAKTVVIAAGALGSTEILHRSKNAGLVVSDKLGDGFTGNGDMLAFAWNCDEKIASVGLEHQDPSKVAGPGPCISGIVDARNHDMKDAFVIEDGTPPGGAGNILQAALMASSKLIGKDKDGGIRDELSEAKREGVSILRGPHAEGGAMDNTLAYLVMAHDDSEGKLELVGNEIKVNWPDVGKQRIFTEVNKKLEEATTALGGTFVRNPVWSKALGNRIVTVHPLGGCNMSDDGSSGVTDHKGRVFSGNGSEVHEGLYVCDGAVLPRSVGVNPFLTICGVAERIVHLAIADMGSESDYDIHPRTGDDIEDMVGNKVYKPLSETKVGIYFTESMVGYISGSYKKTKEKETGFESGYRLGKRKPKENGFRFILTASSPDLDAMLADKDHKADLHGTVTCRKLSPNALTVTNGVFQLFSPDPDHPNDPGHRRMVYNFVMTDSQGKAYYFEGFKHAHADLRLGDPWIDTTTLFIKIWEGDKPEGEPMSMGKLKIKVKDFVTQLGTMRVTNAKTKSQRLEYLTKFGTFFAGAMWNVYMPFGTIADPAKKAEGKKVVLRRRRQLRVEPPKVYHTWTDDDVRLRLMRYKGGSKGPVLLIHGLSLGSNQHSWDGVETNMVEFLVAKGYDVWNYDWRCSHYLETQHNQWNMDDVARFDHPAAINKILQKTGASSVQVVAQCVGSITIDMSLLGGWLDPKNIRSKVNFSSAVHYEVIPYRELRAGVYQPEILAALGIDGAYSDSDTHVPKQWKEKMFHEVLDFLTKVEIHLPKEDQCDSTTCHRLTYLWGLIWEHGNLNDETHTYQHELFGFACINMFRHLATVVRKGHAVDHHGDDVYMKGAKNMDLPTLLIGGAKNRTWLPSGLEKTYAWLTQDNGFKDIHLKLIDGYGHNDASLGKNAMVDVFPFVSDFLDKYNQEE